MTCTIDSNLKAAPYASELWRLGFTRVARTRRDEIEYMRPPRPTEAAITCTKARKCFTKYLSILQSRPFCWLSMWSSWKKTPSLCSLRVLILSLFALRAAVFVSTETKDIPLCEGQYSCQTSTAGHVLQSPKRYGTLSPSTRTLTHRLALYTLVSTRLGPIQPIVPNSRAPEGDALNFFQLDFR